jgi:hypothetical protein
VANIVPFILRNFDAVLYKAYNVILFTVPTTSTVSWTLSASELNLDQTFTLALSEKIV